MTQPLNLLLSPRKYDYQFHFLSSLGAAPAKPAAATAPTPEPAAAPAAPAPSASSDAGPIPTTPPPVPQTPTKPISSTPTASIPVTPAQATASAAAADAGPAAGDRSESRVRSNTEEIRHFPTLIFFLKSNKMCAFVSLFYLPGKNEQNEAKDRI